MNKFHFTYENLEKQLKKAKDLGYEFIRCKDYVKRKSEINKKKIIVLRVDVDINIKKARVLNDIFKKLDLKASFFIRLHAPEYNPFSFENYLIIKDIISNDNEIGLHSETIDQSVIWDENAKDCLIRDIKVINNLYGIQIEGVASHGGMTGLNNLDFWKSRSPKEFGLLYEAYDEQSDFNLFQESFYISDSEWVRWKCYNKGRLVNGDHRTFGEHITDEHQLIYLLIHSDTYFYSHIYE